MAELVFFRRAEELMRVGLDGRRLTVGRAPSCDIVVPDPAISRLQFAVQRRGDAWLLTDLSGKGTDVGGERVTEQRLADGADVGLAQWRAVFHEEAGDGGAVEATLTDREGQGDTVQQPIAEGETGLSGVRLHLVCEGTEHTVAFTGEAVIGSGERATVQVEDAFVSATHLRLERVEGGVRVQDLQSRNGTFIGAARIFDAVVPLGCTVRVGSTDLVLRRPERSTGVPRFEGMVGTDPAMRKVYETVERIAPSQAAVAIFGESGTGKELVARAIHQRSSRADGPFIPVNCGALNKELVESELFGHERGAFTGAEKQHKGAFEEADHGTLFLDEIGELALPLQAKLLRALELGEIKRVGSSKPMNVDVRIVAATNRDLRAEARRGTFREDLYWRLCVIPVMLPPLRARKGDLGQLVRHFMKLYAPSHAGPLLSPAAEARLAEHSWPGNVRELRNVLHRSLLLRKGERIEADDLHFEADSNTTETASEPGAGYDPCSDDLERVFIVGKSAEALEDEVFLKTWRRLGGGPTKVANALKQSRGAIYRRMEKLGMSPGDKDE